MVKLTANQYNVLQYLRKETLDSGGVLGFVSPTQIGRDIRGYPYDSTWGSRICKSLVKKGLVVRSSQGWYRAVDFEVVKIR